MIIFDNDITLDSIVGLLSELKLHESTEENPFHLYFATNGGHVSYMEALVDYLNIRQDDVIVHIYDDLHSAGILMLTNFKGKIVIHHENELFFVIHNIDRKINTRRKTHGIDQNKFLPGIDRLNKRLYKKLKKIGLTKKQIKRLKKGKDVILFGKEIKKLKI